MPRTKAPRKKAEKQSRVAQTFLPIIEQSRKEIINEAENLIENYILNVRRELQKSKFTIPKLMLNKTIGELMELPLNWSGTTSASVLQLDATKTIIESMKKPKLRSSSVGEDEGYLTAESSKSTSGDRKSRARNRLQKSVVRTSRSLSTRTKRTASMDKYKTPGNKIPKNSYGTVTPKVKPNTPQVVLRRPMVGEVALSLQGSPLLTGAVVTDNVANINIPLDDGRLFSIQPQRGLRLSQIPNLDMKTRRDLETLRDNLNKVCALSSQR